MPPDLLVTGQLLSIDRWRMPLWPSGCVGKLSPEQRAELMQNQKEYWVLRGHPRKWVSMCPPRGGGLVTQGVMGSGRHVATVLRLLLGAGCLPEANAASAPNDDSFTVNHFQK